MEVQSDSRIRWNRSAPVTAVARLSVSDKGDVRSPKKAPETIAPAVISGDMPRLAATPIRPTPIVPITVQELPTAMATRAQMISVDT